MEKQDLPLNSQPGAQHGSFLGKARLLQKFRVAPRATNLFSANRKGFSVLMQDTSERGSFCSYHNPRGRAQIQLNDKAVLTGQEGDPCGGDQEVGPGLDRLVRLPPIRQDAENIKLIF